MAGRIVSLTTPRLVVWYKVVVGARGEEEGGGGGGGGRGIGPTPVNDFIFKFSTVSVDGKLSTSSCNEPIRRCITQ
jgi:hypothetical protein